MVKLLSPAGDWISLKTAIDNGADEVYCGLKDLSMRANIKNFTKEELRQVVKYVHENNKRIFLCTNTVIYENDLKKLREIYDFANSIEIDAVIVSDLGAMFLANEYGLETHISVQANITNTEAIKFYSKYAKRIVLSRELTLRQIKEIKSKLRQKNINIELEGFVHGSLCVAISGRCFLSAYLFNKHANCGECMQPCRRKWKLINEHFDGTYELICEGKYLLSPKDLCMIEHLPEMVNVFDCLKIEGRAKSPEYVMITTKVYREALDSLKNGTYFKKLPYFKKELEKVFNRGYDTGFYFRDKKNVCDFQYNIEGNASKYRKIEIGKVINFYKKPMVAEIKLSHNIKIGDEIIIIGNKTGCIREKVKSMEINRKKVDFAKKGQSVGIKLDHVVRKNDKVYMLKEVY